MGPFLAELTATKYVNNIYVEAEKVIKIVDTWSMPVIPQIVQRMQRILHKNTKILLDMDEVKR